MNVANRYESLGDSSFPILSIRTHLVVWFLAADKEPAQKIQRVSMPPQPPSFPRFVC
jgi:hypothetical protein